MSQLPVKTAVQISRPAAGSVEEVQVPPKAYLDFTFSLDNATSAKKGDDLVITLPDGAVVVCLGYFRNTVEDGLPPIVVQGKEMALAALASMFPNGEIEGVDLLAYGLEAAEDGENKEAPADPADLANPTDPAAPADPANEHLVKVTQPGQNPGPSAGQPGQNNGGTDNQPTQNQNGNGGPNQQGDGQSPSSPNTHAGHGNLALDGLRFRDDHNIDFLKGINRLPGLDLGSNRGFENTEIWGGPTLENPPSAYLPPAPPSVPPTIFTQIKGLKEAGYNASGAPVGTPTASHTIVSDLPPDADIRTFTLKSTVFPGTSDPQTLEQGQTYNTPYGKFSFTVSKVAKVDENGIPVTNPDGSPVYEAQITLTYSDLNNSAVPVNSLGLGAFLEEKFSFQITAQNTAGANIALGSHNVSFVIEGSNDAPSLTNGMFADPTGNQIVHAEVKEEGVYLGNTPTRPGTWDDFNAGTDAATHKNNVTFYLHGTDPDKGDSLSYSVTAIAANSGTTVSPTLEALGGNRFAVKLDNQQCGILTFDSTGKAVFTLNNSANIIQKMNNGDTYSLKLTVQTQDQHGLSSNSIDITLDIHGTNDIPVLTVPSTATLTLMDGSTQIINATGTENNRTFTFTESGNNTTHNKVEGNLSSTDADNTSGELYYIAKGDISGKNSLTPGTDTVALNGSNAILEGKYGTLVLNKNGKFTYTENGKLSTGENGSDTFTVLVQDANGAFHAKNITFTVNGKYNSVDASGANYVINFVEHGVLFETNDENNATNCTGSNKDLLAKDFYAGNVRTFENGQAVFTDDDDPTSKTILFSLTAKSGTASTITTETINGEVWQIHTTQYGVLRLNTNTGDYTYTMDESKVQHLKHSEILEEKFSLSITKGGTSYISRDFTVSIRGMNDRPDITVQDLEVTEDGTTTASYQATAIDPDAGDKTTFSLMTPDRATKLTYLEGSYGGLKLQDNGTYTYELDNSKAQRLGRGETVTDTFIIRVTDKNEAYTEKTITVTIHGTYDAPILSYSTGSVYEDGAKDAVLPGTGILKPVEGTLGLSTTDTMHGAQENREFYVKYEGNAISKSTSAEGGVTYEIIKTEFGELKFNTKDGSYSYTMNSATNLKYQDKNIGDIFETEKFTVTGTFKNPDNVDSTVTAGLTIELKGSNDAPIFVTSGIMGIDPKNPFVIQRDYPTNRSPTKSGTVIANDIDNKDLQDAGVNANTTELYFYFSENGEKFQNIATQYGSVSINGKTGVYIYTLNNLHNDIIGLTASQSKTDTFEVWVTDTHGAKVSQTITVTITGRDGTGGEDINYELPTVDLVVKEDSNLDVTQRPDPAQPDPGRTDNSGPGAGPTPDTTIKRYCFSVGGSIQQSIVGLYGTMYIDALTGEYEYVLNNEADIVQRLGANDSKEERFDVYTYTIANGRVELGSKLATPIKVTVQGTNDAPELTVVQADAIKIIPGATTGNSTTGTCSVKDTDTKDTHTYSTDKTDLTYGTVSINPNTGAYIYTYDPTKGPITGSTTETFTIYVNDGTDKVGKTVTINLQLVNGKPVITGSAVDISDGATCTDYTAQTYTYGSGTFTLDPTTGALLYDGSTLSTNPGALQAHLNESTTASVVKGTLSTWDYEVDSGGGSASSYLYFLCDSTGGSLKNFAADKYGTLQMDKDGTYSFTLNFAGNEVKALQEGENHTLEFWVLVKDANGLAPDPQKLEITIHGTNNQPIISTTGDFALAEGNTTAVVPKTLSLVDPDFDFEGTKGTFTIACAGQNTDTSEITGSLSTTSGVYTYQTAYGKFILDFTDKSNITYKFELDRDADIVKDLTSNQNISMTYSITFNDGQTKNSDSNTVDVNVTIQGQDAPVFKNETFTSSTFTGIFDMDNKTADVLSANQSLTHTGTFTARDSDGEILAFSGGGTGSKGGSLTVNADGRFNYTFAAGDTAKSLENFNERFTVRVTDSTSLSDNAYVDVTYNHEMNQLQFILNTDAVA